MSTHSLDSDFIGHEPSSKPRHVGFLGLLRAFTAAIREGLQAYSAYLRLTQSGVPHDKAVRQVLTRWPARR